MTSSYNLSRRPLKQLLSPINWDAYQRQFGVCYSGYITVPIAQSGNCTDWKICVPIKNKDGMPASYPEMADLIDRPINQTRHYTSDLYHHPQSQTQNRTNMYPRRSRRAERRYSDKEDYFRLPMNFDGTGYNPVRSWAYPEYAADHVQLPDEWNPFQLLQRREVQKQNERALQQRKDSGAVPYTEPYLGTFYKKF